MKRTTLLIVGVALVVVLSKLLIEDVLGLTLAPIGEAWFSRAGAGSALAVVTLLAADVLLPIPSSIVMVVSGAAFGVFWGSCLSLVGSIGGEWLGFELAQRYGRRVSRLVLDDADRTRLESVFAHHGLAAVMFTRALPVAMETMSVVAGLSGMKRGRFLIASLLGTIPVVVVYAYAGAVSRQTDSVVPAVVMLVAVTGCAWLWMRVRKAQNPTT